MLRDCYIIVWGQKALCAVPVKTTTTVTATVTSGCGSSVQTLLSAGSRGGENILYNIAAVIDNSFCAVHVNNCIIIIYK